MKKRIISILLALPLTFVSCGNSNKNSGKTDEVSGTIKVVTSITDNDELLEEMETKFIEKYPNVEDIVWESSTDYDKYILTRMNTTDYGDVLFVPFSMNGNASDYEKFLEPLGTVEDLDKEYFDVTEADYNSNVYGLPASINILGIIYNEDVLKKAGIDKFPTTTEEFIEACEKIKENTDAVPFYSNYSRVAVWGGALSSYGGNNFKEEVINKGTAFQEGQPLREVMDLFYELSSKGLIEEDPVTGDQGKGYQMVANGEAAMIMRATQDVPTIQALNPESNIKIAPFPVEIDGKTSLALGTPTVVGINKNSTNKATARAFLDFFISKESGYSESLQGYPSKKSELSEEDKKLFDSNNIVLTAPSTADDIEAKYSKISNEVGVGRLGDVLQKTINIGLYPEKNESYADYINSLESKWESAVKNNE